MTAQPRTASRPRPRWGQRNRVPLPPAAISELTQVEGAQLVSDVLGHGRAILLGQETSSEQFGFCQQFGMGPQEGAQDAGSLDR
jgi:hypothetical protein